MNDDRDHNVCGARYVEQLGVPVTELSADSRKIAPGIAFAAYPGEHSDGRSYIAAALAAGTHAVFWDPDRFAWNEEWRVANTQVPDLRSRVGAIASAVYGDPSLALDVVGVTGTNGKTSCCHWIAQAMHTHGQKFAVVGTLGNGFLGELAASANTTPDAIELQRAMRDYRAVQADGVAMEASSHGLAQGRVNGVRFNTAVFTNLTRDHLDYHGTMEEYQAAKARLFQWPGLRHAVINVDDAFGRVLADRIAPSVNVIGYGIEAGALRASRVKVTRGGLAFSVASPWGNADIEVPVLGEFNVANLLAVLGTLLARDIPFDDAVRAVASVTPVRGRMQFLTAARAPVVVIDYAHTPDALEKALATLRKLVPSGGQLICVFGCGGNRDRGKRPAMGMVAEAGSDRVVVTSDNPRDEYPAAIIAEIVAPLTRAYDTVIDRRAAIEHAIGAATEKDIVLVAGKGHETYQEVAGVKSPFSDFQVARAALEKFHADA